MPHSEQGFSESVMGIMRNMVSYGYRMVNLLKPCWSLHAHSCHCPVTEPTGECTMGINLYEGVFTCVLPVVLQVIKVWRHVIVDISKDLPLVRYVNVDICACIIISKVSHFNPRGTDSAVHVLWPQCHLAAVVVGLSLLLCLMLRFVLVCRFLDFK